MRRSAGLAARIPFALVIALCLLRCKVGCQSELASQGEGNGKFGASKSMPTPSMAASLWKIITDMEGELQSLMEKVLSALPEVLRDTENVLSKMSNRILFTFVSSGNVFSEVFLRLNDIQSEFQQFSHDVDEKFDWAVAYLNQTLMDHTESFNTWGARVKEQLRSANDTKLYSKGCQVVDDLMLSSAKQLRQCCNITIKPMLSLCHGVRDLVLRALHVLADAVDRVQACLEDKNSYLEYMMPCINSAYDDLSALTTRANQLRKKLSATLPVKILYSRCCIAIVLVEIEQRQSRFEEDLIAKTATEQPLRYT